MSAQSSKHMNVAIVEDEESVIKEAIEELKGKYDISIIDTVHDAYSLLIELNNAPKFSLIVCDILMDAKGTPLERVAEGEYGGYAILRSIRESNIKTADGKPLPILVITITNIEDEANGKIKEYLDTEGIGFYPKKDKEFTPKLLAAVEELLKNAR